jgi:hypothetical protein
MTELNILLATAVTIAFVHTLIGVDHYIPFVALSRANDWSMKKTMLIVLICGLGHVLSSVALGGVGIALSAAVSLLVDIENIRGEIATWFLIAFGLVYMVYGIRVAVKNKTHTHDAKRPANVFWGLFILFILGPCEPLIPILMYPAAVHNIFALMLVTACFATVTITTMALMTFLGIRGIRLLKINALEHYSHALAGLAVLVCGVSLWALPI